jgi:hypothetical protein
MIIHEVRTTDSNIIFGHIARGVLSANRGQRGHVALRNVLHFNCAGRRRSGYVAILAFEQGLDASHQPRGGSRIPASETKNGDDLKSTK